MASKSSIAIRCDAAIEVSRDAIRAIWGEEFDLPRRHRDLTMLRAIQLEAMAAYLLAKAEAVAPAEAGKVSTPEPVKPKGKAK